ncbi:DUF3574 domain-containing protein [Pseudoxanthomonas daejeonensis]|uniref:Lipoprotein n=1 Tax=Pseudoxanthomonas daejeonensis TaxID=266062 RepID=A0ABQ6Z3F0_9GAMM|nr:DUF3574 domain-containing protein [Pseudoxanthomonas daejeonensis]KAF1691833.1 hypothetical protein CSC65_15785 [Pseudoxanthomonas daejeonensis]
MSIRTLFPILLASLLAACAGAPPLPADAPAPHIEGDAARAAQAQGWLRSELYFGMGSEDGAPSRVQAEPTSEERWREFLDREVTPRFPDGLTVFDAYGQWLFRGDPGPDRLRTKVLVVLHEDTPRRRADIEAIRLAWKQATGHQSVLWSRHPVEVAF